MISDKDIQFATATIALGYPVDPEVLSSRDRNFPADGTCAKAINSSHEMIQSLARGFVDKAIFEQQETEAMANPSSTPSHEILNQYVDDHHLCDHIPAHLQTNDGLFLLWSDANVTFHQCDSKVSIEPLLSIFRRRGSRGHDHRFDPNAIKIMGSTEDTADNPLRGLIDSYTSEYILQAISNPEVPAT